MADWGSWIGRTSASAAWLDPAQANRMAATLDRAPEFRAGDPLPPAWHWLYFHDIVPASQLGPDGHPALGLVLPPVPLPRRMWAGGSFAFHAPLRLGDTAERATTIRSIAPKTGRSGPLFFVTVEHALHCGGTLCLLEEQVLVYRELAPAVAEAQPAPAEADYTERYQLEALAPSSHASRAGRNEKPEPANGPSAIGAASRPAVHFTAAPPIAPPNRYRATTEARSARPSVAAASTSTVKRGASTSATCTIASASVSSPAASITRRCRPSLAVPESANDADTLPRSFVVSGARNTSSPDGPSAIATTRESVTGASSPPSGRRTLAKKFTVAPGR